MARVSTVGTEDLRTFIQHSCGPPHPPCWPSHDDLHPVQMRRYTGFVVAFIAATFLVDVSGYSSGQVSGVCTSMAPNHGPSAQTSDAPFQVTASSSTFNPGDVITVTLKSNLGVNFRGFLLEARSAVSTSTIPLGTFNTTSPEAQLLNCNVDGITYNDSAVSHNSKSEKNEIIVTWTAPNTGHIKFRATFVMTKETFWIGVKSQIIQSMVTGSSVTPFTSFQNQITVDGCGTTKFCFNNPAQCNPATDPNCYFMSSTKLNDEGLRFEMSGKSSGYISIGFSDDKIMGNDDVYICGTDRSERIRVQRAYSTGRSPPRIEQLDKVDDITVANKNGIIQCSFVTRNNVSIAKRTANNMYYLFFAYGPSTDGTIGKHQDSPFISSEKINVADVSSVSGNNKNSVLIKTHGALMLIAWMTTGSIGTLIAQYFKCVGGTKKILGKDCWFQIHWTIMTLTVALTITGFVLAFVHVKGWSEDAGSHPVIGCVVMGLVLIQPTIAIFRPAPDHKRHWIFRVFHSTIGFVIKPLAAATLFMGLLLINVAPNKWPVKVLGGYYGWELLTHILLIVVSCFKRKAVQCNTEKKVYHLLLVFIVYLCGNMVFLIAILVGIGQA
ncbi:putative ferric-chelate reductase 1 isoform X2 [Narcine bancroftii]|uniref:putative ferric-chelate reductase 1 isoform X2 n=1 Tax=Narcine bancroftii TaxID=1343680 RepID=UPI003831930C